MVAPSVILSVPWFTTTGERAVTPVLFVVTVPAPPFSSSLIEMVPSSPNIVPSSKVTEPQTAPPSKVTLAIVSSAPLSTRTISSLSAEPRFNMVGEISSPVNSLPVVTISLPETFNLLTK